MNKLQLQEIKDDAVRNAFLELEEFELYLDAIPMTDEEVDKNRAMLKKVIDIAMTIQNQLQFYDINDIKVDKARDMQEELDQHRND